MNGFQSKPYRAAKVGIDLSALQHNFQQAKKVATSSNIMPVIKANAYGHGLLQVADALQQADGFAVAQITEAIALREHGIVKPITVFQGFLNARQLELTVEYNLRPAISQQWQLDFLQSIQTKHALDIWVKVNTGMGRLGFQLENVVAIVEQLQCHQAIDQIGLMMHFANADVADHASNLIQVERFHILSAELKDISTFDTSAQNSAAMISGLLSGQDWVRPGIMLYGASPLAEATAVQLDLKPVMSLHAQLIAINQLKKGQSVGYGDSWICPQDMPVGIVNIGYGDGYPRHAVAAPLAVNAQRCQLIGRVSMDSIAIDLRGIKAQCGDQVECWGKQVSVDEVAASAQTIAYELLCNVGRIQG